MFYDIAPIVVLVTTLMTFSLLARTNEITACKALGMSLYRLALPALAAALLVTLFCGYLESSVLPASNEKVAKLKDRIQRHGRRRAPTGGRTSSGCSARGGTSTTTSTTTRSRQSLQRLQVFDFDERHRLTRRLYTDRRATSANAWLFTNGWARSFDGRRGDRLQAVSRSPRSSRYSETPGVLRLRDPPPGADALRRAQGVHPGAQGERPGRPRAPGASCTTRSPSPWSR